QVYGAVPRSAHAHAKIVSVDTAEASKANGVLAVLTAKDIPGEPLIGGVIQDQPLLALDKVRMLGDGIALVAAETEEQAREALSLIKAEYEPLPIVDDPRKALRPESVNVHENGNLVLHHVVRHGNPDVGFEYACRIYERFYITPRVEHAYIEPECVLAKPTEDGGVEVVGSIQNLFSTRRKCRCFRKSDSFGKAFGRKNYWGPEFRRGSGHSRKTSPKCGFNRKNLRSRNYHCKISGFKCN
ncbi:MAG: xanthine dehydrogenase family protein, partial [Candidatus Methanomethylicaceae archaeon]